MIDGEHLVVDLPARQVKVQRDDAQHCVVVHFGTTANAHMEVFDAHEAIRLAEALQRVADELLCEHAR